MVEAYQIFKDKESPYSGPFPFPFVQFMRQLSWYMSLPLIHQAQQAHVQNKRKLQV